MNSDQREIQRKLRVLEHADKIGDGNLVNVNQYDNAPASGLQSDFSVTADVYQDGNGNSADVIQEGRVWQDNSLKAYVTQVGDGNQADVTQTGKSNTGTIDQIGGALFNMASIDQSGYGNGAQITQTGYFNTADVLQRSGRDSATITQRRERQRRRHPAARIERELQP